MFDFKGHLMGLNASKDVVKFITKAIKKWKVELTAGGRS